MLRFAQLLFFIIFSPGVALAQTVSGYVYDENENLPLKGAMVYFDGTTYSANTNEQGFFSIATDRKLQAALVISYVGFRTLRIDNAFDYTEPFKVLLQEDAILMDEIVVTGKTIFSRKEMLKAFREHFLGTSKAGQSCNIENEEDIRLRFDTNTNTLIAEASKPIKIINSRLQYNVLFDLSTFEVVYGAKTLSTVHVQRTFVGGTTLYTDISKKGGAEKKRKEAYLGSQAHLIRTIAHQDWERQKFQLYIDGFWEDHKKYFHVTDTIGARKIVISKPPDKPKPKPVITITSGSLPSGTGSREPDRRPVAYAILYDKKQQSFFMCDKGVLYVDEDGQHWPVRELTFGGYMGSLKVGDMLPANYKADE